MTYERACFDFIFTVSRIRHLLRARWGHKPVCKNVQGNREVLPRLQSLCEDEQERTKRRHNV